MPRPLTQNRDQVLARQALITAQNSSQFLQSRQASQSAADAIRQTEDKATSVHQQDRFVQQNLQAMDARLQQTAFIRTANNETQAAKTAASQQDLEAYLSAQVQRKLMNPPMTFGYA